MNCADAEILICDYATLRSDERFELERHLAVCPACAELARDSAAALAFLESAADVEPPPELITRILYDAPWTKTKQRKSRLAEWAGSLLSPIFNPKFAMGMAMTVLSLSMLARFVMPARQLRPADLKPAEVWNGIATRAEYAWGRTVKFYDNLKIVYQIQTTLKEWQQQTDEQPPAAGKTDERKLPVKRPVSPAAPEK
jgi:hypothetical protein